MAPYDNLPNFRKLIEQRVRTSRLRNDAQILADHIRYKLSGGNRKTVFNFHLKYRGKDWFVGVSVAPNSIPYYRDDEVVVELTDEALNSIITQCLFNEGVILNELERQRKTQSNNTTTRAEGY